MGQARGGGGGVNTACGVGLQNLLLVDKRKYRWVRRGVCGGGGGGGVKTACGVGLQNLLLVDKRKYRWVRQGGGGGCMDGDT